MGWDRPGRDGQNERDSTEAYLRSRQISVLTLVKCSVETATTGLPKTLRVLAHGEGFIFSTEFMIALWEGVVNPGGSSAGAGARSEIYK